jgi:hypothetical protein
MRTIFVLYAIVLSSYFIVLLPKDVISALAVEDGIIETVGAIAFLLASMGFFTAYGYSSGLKNNFGRLQTRRNLYYFLLGLLFLICFGEEISWGQRLFNWATPDWLEARNIQGETNLHNIELFHGSTRDGTPRTGIGSLLKMNRLFSLFWLLYCVVTPLAYLASRRLREWCDWIGLPLVPLWIGGLFVANAVVIYWIFTAIEVTDPLKAYDVNELKETNYAIIFLILAWWELRHTILSRPPNR